MHPKTLKKLDVAGAGAGMLGIPRTRWEAAGAGAGDKRTPRKLGVAGAGAGMLGNPWTRRGE